MKNQIRRAAPNPEEAARFLGISRNLAYQMCQKGKIPAVRLGRRWLVPLAALEEMLNEARQPKQKQINGE